jgi:hypothetical protein
MKASGKIIGRLIVGYLFACCALQNANAQPIPPGGGGGGTGGGEYTNSYFSGVINTNFLISVQDTNIVLNWRSSTNKIFLLENRATLTGSTWGELTNYYLSAPKTNWTRFVHTNIAKTQATGFYRLFEVTPVANADFYSVDQDSSANQLDIFQNDSSPNDDLIYISNLVPAHHGGISYSLDASTFQYTPDSGFYGADSFGYSITSNHGDVSSNATVTVFVNQTGNQPPSANDLVITLQTNIYTAAFNALTNSSDPDGDTVTLFFVTSPSLGCVSNDASGNITYTRNSNLFGSDAFTYIVTDGNGGSAVGNVKILQVDTTGTGLPDQWNMCYGFDPTIDNTMADPDNDGLPNLAEFVLGTNPHVADNPLNFASLTDGEQVSGFAQLPIYGLSPAIATPPITLYLNGTPADNSSLWQGPDGNWVLNWDTSFLSNGIYQVQLACKIHPPALDDAFTNILGTAKTLQVNNPIMFSRLTSRFTDFIMLVGQLAVTNSTFDVDLYDDDGNLLAYARNLSVPNGLIQLYWDLTDGQGNQISFGNIQSVFTVYPSAISSQGVRSQATQPPQFSRQWALKDNPNINPKTFLVAWGWDNYGYLLYNNRVELMQDGVINILGNPSDFDSYNLFPAVNVPYSGQAFRYDNDLDRSVLIDPTGRHSDDYNRSGNFFWFGHGGELHDDFICGNANHSNISASDVQSALQNKAFLSSQKHPYNDKHPYRLTILAACDTYTAGWAGAFGVEFSTSTSTDSVYDYADVDRPQRAFVGWDKKIYVPGWNDVSGLLHAEYAQALGQLFGYWMAGYPLNYCMQKFSDNALASEPYYFKNSDAWKISGCYDLQRTDQ